VLLLIEVVKAYKTRVAMHWIWSSSPHSGGRSSAVAACLSMAQLP